MQFTIYVKDGYRDKHKVGEILIFNNNMNEQGKISNLEGVWCKDNVLYALIQTVRDNNSLSGVLLNGSIDFGQPKLTSTHSYTSIERNENYTHYMWNNEYSVLGHDSSNEMKARYPHWFL